MSEAFGLFRSVGKDPLAFVADREVDRRRRLFANDCVTFNLPPNFVDGFDGLEETMSESLVFADQAEQEVLGFDIWRAELARFVSREEHDSTGLLGVALKH